MDKAVLESLTKLLWPVQEEQAGQQVYWLVDGARDPQIASLIRSSGLQYECLFAGDLHPRLQAAAPYLVYLQPESSSTALLLNLGWGKAWGIFALALPDITLAQLRLHFKKFLRVQTEAGKELAFRFYDPRVLNAYLPSCTAPEFISFIGPLTSLCAELTDGGGIRIFEVNGASVEVRVTPLK